MKIAFLITMVVVSLAFLSEGIESYGQTTPLRTESTDQVQFELRIQRILQQLESDDQEERDAAEQALIALGEAALTLLPEITPATSAETKERLTRIRDVLDQAAMSTAMTPSRVTLQGELTLAEVLEEIETQTGNRVVDFRRRYGQSGDKKLSVDLDDVAFWPAMDRLLDQAGMTINVYTGEVRTVGLVAASDNQIERSGSASYPGVFRVEATQVQSQRKLRVSNGSDLRIRLEVLWEPRVLPVLIRQPYRELQLIGDDGNSIDVMSTEGVAEAPILSTVAGIELVIPFQRPDRSVKHISSLKGKMFALVPGREETFEFDSLATARNIVKQRGGLEVTLQRVRKNGAVYEFRIRLRLLNVQQTFQSHLDWASNNVVYLIDSNGNKIGNPNFERYLEREREVGFGYLFPLSSDLDDYRLVYRSPAAILTVPIEYELRNIALP